MRALVIGANGTQTGGLSMLHMLFFVNTFGGNILNLNGSGPGQANEFRVASPGAQQMANLIAAQLGKFGVRTNSPVTAIDQSGQAAIVWSNNTAFQAKRVIVAALRDPVGRIHWAGVDTATHPYASMSGAIQSGKRAAHEVLPLL